MESCPDNLTWTVEWVETVIHVLKEGCSGGQVLALVYPVDLADCEQGYVVEARVKKAKSYLHGSPPK